MNKLQTLLIAGVAAGFAFAVGPAQAFPTYNFTGSDEGGTGSATATFSITQDLLLGTATIVVDLDNTSPITLDGSTDPNAPGIAGFGFDLDPAVLANLDSWDLIGLTNLLAAITIGSSSTAGLDWIMGSTQASVTLDYLPQVETGVDGLLYNPAAIGSSLLPGGANSSYFTTATLTLNLSNIFVAVTIDEYSTTGGGGSPYVRMQNVGAGGEGSLKLVGTPVPEPATLALLGIGLLGAGYMARRRRLEA